MIKKLVLLILFAVLPSVVLGQTQKAPALELKDLRGRVHRLSNYEGKVVLLNFWATWRPPCRAEAPDQSGGSVSTGAAGYR